MVKTDTFTGLEMQLENCPFRSAWTGNGYNINRTVRENNYETRLGEREGI